MISLVHVEADKNKLGFVSDADEIGNQMLELRNSDNEPKILEEARKQLSMPSPGISDTQMRHIDMSTSTLCAAPPKNSEANLLPDGQMRYKPVLIMTFDSLYE